MLACILCGCVDEELEELNECQHEIMNIKVRKEKHVKETKKEIQEQEKENIYVTDSHH